MIRLLLFFIVINALMSCGHRNDGMGQLYKGVACKQSGTC